MAGDHCRATGHQPHPLPPQSLVPATQRYCPGAVPTAVACLYTALQTSVGQTRNLHEILTQHPAWSEEQQGY